MFGGDVTEMTDGNLTDACWQLAGAVGKKAGSLLHLPRKFTKGLQQQGKALVSVSPVGTTCAEDDTVMGKLEYIAAGGAVERSEHTCVDARGDGFKDAGVAKEGSALGEGCGPVTVGDDSQVAIPVNVLADAKPGVGGVERPGKAEFRASAAGMQISVAAIGLVAATGKERGIMQGKHDGGRFGDGVEEAFPVQPLGDPVKVDQACAGKFVGDAARKAAAAGKIGGSRTQAVPGNFVREFIEERRCGIKACGGFRIACASRVNEVAVVVLLAQRAVEPEGGDACTSCQFGGKMKDGVWVFF